MFCFPTGGSDIQPFTSAENGSSVPIDSIRPAAAGLPTFLTIEANNNVRIHRISSKTTTIYAYRKL